MITVFISTEKAMLLAVDTAKDLQCGFVQKSSIR